MQSTHVDQLGRVVRLPASPPKRIVSLVPSQTELLHALGLEEEVVGITKFCIHPKSWFRSKARVGGTKDFRIEKVLALQPDLVIANKEENEKGSLELLEKFVPVWISDVRSVDAAEEMIRCIAEITERSDAAAPLLEKINNDFLHMSRPLEGKRVAYAIWYDPWMFASNDTFIGDVLERLGAFNIIKDADGRYPTLSMEALGARKPDIILLSSEPFPFKAKHANLLKVGVPNAKIVHVDGSYFSWYGSRLADAGGYFRELFETPI